MCHTSRRPCAIARRSSKSISGKCCESGSTASSNETGGTVSSIACCSRLCHTWSIPTAPCAAPASAASVMGACVCVCVCVCVCSAAAFPAFHRCLEFHVLLTNTYYIRLYVICICICTYLYTLHVHAHSKTQTQIHITYLCKLQTHMHISKHIRCIYVQK